MLKVNICLITILVLSGCSAGPESWNYDLNDKGCLIETENNKLLVIKGIKNALKEKGVNNTDAQKQAEEFVISIDLDNMCITPQIMSERFY